jgi:uncharacterized phage protein gp47/JayE
MGYEIKSESDIINDILVDIVKNVTRVNDLNPGSVIRTLSEALGQEVYLSYIQLQNIYDGTRILTAAGEDLDNLGSIIGVTRIPGVSAEGLVTFQRETSLLTNFTIPIGSIVSTQPGLKDIYNFTTIENKTFPAIISGEAIAFKDGIRKYKLSQRKLGDITSFSGTQDSAPKSFVLDTDYIIVRNFDGYLIDGVSTVTTLDDCDAADWSNSADATADATDAVNFIEGTYAIKLGKSGTASKEAYYRKTLASAVSVEGKIVFANIRIADEATRDKIESIKIRISTDYTPTNNYYERTILPGDLVIGFEKYELNPGVLTSLSVVGFPNVANINSLQIKITTIATSTTLTSGDVNMDFWFASKSNSYVGDVIEFISPATYPDDGTSFTLTWKPLSVDILCSANEIGDDYNVSAGSIIYKVSSLPFVNLIYNYVPMSGGTNTEIDDAYRTRIINTASAPGKATINALQNALLSVPGVLSVAIDDMPLMSITDEPHIYNALATNYRLNNEVAFVDDPLTPTNIVISDTFGGSADYTYDTDYVLNSNNEIVWKGATEPGDTDIFYVSYDCNLLGHVNILVAGNVTPLSATLTDAINAAIDNTKAAGVSVVWTETSIAAISIECTVTVDSASGYNEETVKNNVYEALINWLNNKVIGEDVLLSEFYKAVVSVPGVKNVEIDDWNGQTPPFLDITIAYNEIAKPADSGIIVN